MFAWIAKLFGWGTTPTATESEDRSPQWQVTKIYRRADDTGVVAVEIMGQSYEFEIHQAGDQVTARPDERVEACLQRIASGDHSQAADVQLAQCAKTVIKQIESRHLNADDVPLTGYPAATTETDDGFPAVDPETVDTSPADDSDAGELSPSDDQDEIPSSAPTPEPLQAAVVDEEPAPAPEAEEADASAETSASPSGLQDGDHVVFGSGIPGTLLAWTEPDVAHIRQRFAAGQEGEREWTVPAAAVTAGPDATEGSDAPAMDDTSVFIVGDQVTFARKASSVKAEVLRVNRKSVTVTLDDGSTTRVAPTAVHAVVRPS